jgi:hypothetical protein
MAPLFPAIPFIPVYISSSPETVWGYLFDGSIDTFDVLYLGLLDE